MRDRSVFNLLKSIVGFIEKIEIILNEETREIIINGVKAEFESFKDGYNDVHIFFCLDSFETFEFKSSRYVFNDITYFLTREQLSGTRVKKFVLIKVDNDSLLMSEILQRINELSNLSLEVQNNFIEPNTQKNMQ